MFKCSSRVDEAIPVEYQAITQSLFPSGGYAPGAGPPVQAAQKFAEILGIGTDYDRYLSAFCPASEQIWGKDARVLLEHFQNNLDLLIQKTWVEQADADRKQKLEDRIPGFISALEQGDLQEALVEFGVILEELAYLFFGGQSHKEDFTEYTLRIDTQMGLFWWYGGKLGQLSNFTDKLALRALLLIGICYLTNF
ncbi:MAG: hypothetical protein LBH73_05620 [Spirochaetaceae bacterium]|nr:hypothetical protein [Spirochaetaceae bacterium]